jgi:hypothetical protein
MKPSARRAFTTAARHLQATAIHEARSLPGRLSTCGCGTGADGVFTPDGEFLQLPSLDTTAILEVFRRLLLRRLHEAERLSEAFMDNLLSWVHPGFSVFAGPSVEPTEVGSLWSLRPAISPALQWPWTHCRNEQTEPWRWRHRRTLGPARPHSSWIRWNGFTGSRHIFPILAHIPDAPMEPIVTGQG